MTLSPRPEFATVLAGVRGTEVPVGPKTGAAAEILDALSRRGALFFDEIVNATRRIKTDVERGLRELVAWGLVTSDGFQGLGSSLASRRTRAAHGRAKRRNTAAASSAAAAPPDAGPWCTRPTTPQTTGWPMRWPKRLRACCCVATAPSSATSTRARASRFPGATSCAPWTPRSAGPRARRSLRLRPVGEQYALPEAVDALRAVRRSERKGERVWVSAVDAVNLVGVLIETGATDGGASKRVPAQPGKGVMFIDGLPQLGDLQQPVAMKPPVPSRALGRLRRGLPSR